MVHHLLKLGKVEQVQTLEQIPHYKRMRGLTLVLDILKIAQLDQQRHS
jgi:hypothetical protein